MFRSILCPTDFSEHAERALTQALALADLTGAHLTLVHVVDPLLDAGARAAGSHDAIHAQTQRELHDLLARLSKSGHKTPSRLAVSVVVGRPANEILKQVEETQADLIVMGTQGLSGARRMLFGSTTEGVLRESHVPVLAVPRS